MTRLGNAWPETALKHLARVRYGLGQPPPLKSNGVPILRATNIHRGRLVKQGLVFADLADLPLDRAPLLQAGEILVVRSGAYTGDSALVTQEWAGSAPGYDLRLSPFPTTEPRYLAYALLSAPVERQMEISSSRAAQPHLNAEDLGDIKLPSPPIEKQRQIADYLDGATARIDRLMALLDSAMQRVHERRLRQVYDLTTGASGSNLESTRLSWADQLPADWPVVKVTYVARLGSGHTPSRSRADWWTDGYIPWITTGEVQQVRDDRREVLTTTREMISDLGLANSSAELHPAGSVVLCRTASAGYSAVMGCDMATSQDFAVWTCGPRLDPYYLLWCLRAMRPDLLGRLAMGSTHKTIYMPDIQSLRIPLPPIEMQRRIVDEIRRRNSRLDELLDRIDRQRRVLAERRAVVITAAVSGELDATRALGAA